MTNSEFKLKLDLFCSHTGIGHGMN